MLLQNNFFRSGLLVWDLTCLGELPLDLVADIDRKTISLLGSVLRQDCVEQNLLERHILLKRNNLKSWFVYVGKRLDQYGLPSQSELLEEEKY